MSNIVGGLPVIGLDTVATSEFGGCATYPATSCSSPRMQKASTQWDATLKPAGILRSWHQITPNSGISIQHKSPRWSDIIRLWTDYGRGMLSRCMMCASRHYSQLLLATMRDIVLATRTGNTVFAHQARKPGSAIGPSLGHDLPVL